MMSDPMNEKTVYHQLASPIVFEPIFEKLEKKNLAHTHTLKEAFSKVEQQYPGFSQDFLMAILNRLNLENEINVSETYLRMAAFENPPAKSSRNREFQALETKAQLLKKILGRIPDEIVDRKMFLDTIKEIANAIKNLLDCVSSVSAYLPTGNHKTSLELQKREFVKYSKKFSNTLKAFFKDNQQSEVFASANLLVNQTNLILFVLRDAS